MGVDVHPARCDQKSVRIDFAVPFVWHDADSSNDIAIDRDIGHAPRIARSIDHSSVAITISCMAVPSSSNAVRFVAKWQNTLG